MEIHILPEILEDMEYNSPEFRKWLDKLQRESWQLELIISGFAIYGLFAAIGPVELKSELAFVNESNVMWMWTLVYIAIYILLFNLVFHVLLRGLWIGAVGLRYVSGDIDYDELNYSPKFTTFLRKKVGSFDRYIAQLENYCSILFAITFLLIFYVIGTLLALFIVGFALSLFPTIFGELNQPAKYFFRIFMILLLLIIVLVIIDFIGQGVLKRTKWISKFYFPIYRVLGFLTLSFLYRPLIYNFLDNKFGKRLSMLLIPIYLIISIASSIDYRTSNFLDSYEDSSIFYMVNEHYEDLSMEEGQFIKVASIPSKVITDEYLKVFVLYNENMEDFIFEENTELKPKKDLRGYHIKFFSDFKKGMEMAAGIKNPTDITSYLTAIDQCYLLKIDSTFQNSNFTISTNYKERLGFETYLNIKNLTEGKHILTISGPAKKDDFDDDSETIEKILVTIPFWYYKE